jgi:hypothetical protein
MHAVPVRLYTCALRHSDIYTCMLCRSDVYTCCVPVRQSWRLVANAMLYTISCKMMQFWLHHYSLPAAGHPTREDASAVERRTLVCFGEVRPFVVSHKHGRAPQAHLTLWGVRCCIISHIWNRSAHALYTVLQLHIGAARLADMTGQQAVQQGTQQGMHQGYSSTRLQLRQRCCPEQSWHSRFAGTHSSRMSIPATGAPTVCFSECRYGLARQVGPHVSVRPYPCSAGMVAARPHVSTTCTGLCAGAHLCHRCTHGDLQKVLHVVCQRRAP